MSHPADAPAGGFLDAWPMTYITCTQITGGSLEGFDALNALLPTTEPDGLLARYSGMCGDILVITAVWASKVDSDRFTTEMLRPAIASLPPFPGGPVHAVEYEAVDQFVGQPA
jgi:hypothetical protein